ncbi:uncharacterized protein LOC143371277 [Andrena cerasifolii]|uniref:uncharacterized protein LOC143371277 n=1 Tax=Andrena cerasifolii TaxID=2819439 RepID=UPI004037BCBE
MRLLRDMLLKKDFQKLWGEPLGVKVKYFWNKSWDDHPEIMAIMPLFVIGLGTMGWSFYQTNADDRPPKYYMIPPIFRPDDPRVATIRKDETLCPEKPTSLNVYF